MQVPDPEPEVTEPETEHVWDAVRRVLGEVICHDNARLTAECIALVSGLCYTGRLDDRDRPAPRNHPCGGLEALRAS